MSSNDGTFLSRLLSLLEDLPHHTTELGFDSLTKEDEKTLLVSLSQIFNLIRRCTDEQQQISDRRSVASTSNSEDDDEYLTKIVVKLVLLTNTKSQYVRHSVGNICLAISEFLLAYGRSWDKYVQSLCACFEFMICNILQHLPQSLMNESHKPVVSALIVALNCSSWHGIAEISRILRGFVKFLKGKDVAELVGVLLSCLNACLTNVPWDLLKSIYNDSITEVGGSREAEAKFPEAKFLFLGNFVQLLCSTVDLIGFAEGDSSHCESAFLLEACDLVPRYLDWCHSEDCSHILPYFRHKILMLMIKLSFQMQLGCSVLTQWLQLLQKYYQDFLSGPIAQLQCGQDDSLEDSPFLLALNDEEVSHLSSCHLQRKAVFFFLRCSLSLINLRKTADLKCTCMRSNSLLESDLNTERDCSAEKKGLLEFYEWLRGHVPSIMFSESEINLDICINFAISFIKLYMQEDDVLFEVLLLLFTIPSWAERLFLKQERACHATEEDILFHVSNLFNPLINIFVGHIGDVELSAVAVALSVFGTFVFGFMLGMGSALETLCGQAYGAGQINMLGIYMQRSWLILFGACLMLLPLYIFATPILMLLGQEPDIAELAGTFTLQCLPQMFSLAINFPTQKFLQAQSNVAVMAYIGFVALIVHVVML